MLALHSLSASSIGTEGLSKGSIPLIDDSPKVCLSRDQPFAFAWDHVYVQPKCESPFPVARQNDVENWLPEGALERRMETPVIFVQVCMLNTIQTDFCHVINRALEILVTTGRLMRSEENPSSSFLEAKRF